MERVAEVLDGSFRTFVFGRMFAYYGWCACCSLTRSETFCHNLENSPRENLPCSVEPASPLLHERFPCREVSKLFERGWQKFDQNCNSKMPFRAQLLRSYIWHGHLAVLWYSIQPKCFGNETQPQFFQNKFQCGWFESTNWWNVLKIKTDHMTRTDSSERLSRIPHYKIVSSPISLEISDWDECDVQYHIFFSVLRSDFRIRSDDTFRSRGQTYKSKIGNISTQCSAYFDPVDK